MIRLKATANSYSTTIESIKTLVTSVMPSWSISTKTGSDLFKDIYSTTSEIEKFKKAADSYALSYASGFLFEPRIVYQYDFSNKVLDNINYNITDDYQFLYANSYYDFISQHPSRYSVHSELKNISTEPILYMSSYLDTASEDKFIISTVGKSEIQTFYVDFNHSLISTFTRSYVANNMTYLYSLDESKQQLISTNFSTAFKVSSGTATIDWLTNTNYVEKYDIDKDGFIDQADINNFAKQNSVEASDLSIYINSVKINGYYIFNMESDCEVSEVEYVFINRATDTYITTKNGDSIIAQTLESGILLELDSFGFLYYGDININNEYGLHDSITGFDNFGDGLILSTKNVIYKFMFDTLELTKVYEHGSNIAFVTYLSSDYIVVIDENSKIFILKPHYDKVLLDDSVIYSHEKIDDNFLSRKIVTLLDEMTDHFGIYRYSYESLYDFKNRSLKILGSTNERSFVEMLNLYYSNIYNEREVIYSGYIYASLGNNPTAFSITLDYESINLTLNDGILYNGDVEVGRYSNKYIQIYRNIMKGKELVLSEKKYVFNIFISSKQIATFTAKIEHRPNALNDDSEISDIDKKNIYTSEVLIEEYSKNIYESHHTWGNMKWDSSIFDAINDETYNGSQSTDISNTGTEVSRYGIYDYKSFGDPVVTLVEHASEDDISILTAKGINVNEFDKKTVQEMTVNGGSVSSKLVFNSGRFVDLEDGSYLTKIISNFSVLPNNPVNTYFFPTNNEPDQFISKINKSYSPEYILEKSLSTSQTSDAIYDNTGSIIKYIDHYLLASGKVYLNLFDPTECNFNMKLTNTKANIFSNSEITPDPKKITFRVNNDKKIYSGINFHLFNDYYFSSYIPSVKYGYNTTSESFDLHTQTSTLSQTLVYKEYINQNNSRNPVLSLEDSDILLSEAGFIETLVDDVVINNNYINSWKKNSIEDVFIKNINVHSYPIKYSNIFSRSPEMRTIQTQIQNELGKILELKSVIVDVLLVSKEHFLWSGEGNPIPYHTKERFLSSLKNEENTYLTENNLLLSNSTASLELSAMGYFKENHDYIALVITLNKPIIERL